MTTTTHSHKRWTDKGGHVKATALLSDSGLLVWGVVEGDLVELLVPYVDAHWEALESEQLARAALLCGAYGQRVLRKVEAG